jgi:hypothetical protein
MNEILFKEIFLSRVSTLAEECIGSAIAWMEKNRIKPTANSIRE